LVGSSYEGEGQSGPIYKTRTYKLSELGNFVSGYVGDVSLTDSSEFNSLSQTVTNNTNAIATANQSITTITSDVLSQSTFQTNLSSTFGTFDEDGNLVSLSQAFADQVLQTTASDRYANAQFVTNLAASVGTYDANGNLVTMGQAFADQVLAVTVSDKYATSEFATNLAASFGTYNPDGSIATFSEATANQILQASTTADFADAQFVTNLVSNFGTYDENGNLLTISTSYADQLLQTANTSEFAEASFVTNLASSFGAYDTNGNLTSISNSFADDIISTANTSEFAQASAVQNLGASFGTVNPDGSVSFENTSTYGNAVLNYVDNNSALATQVENLQTTVTNIPQTIRQPNEPDVTAYPLGSIWVDTDDSNAIYILIDGTPRTWSPTTSEALGELILSNAQLETEIELLSDNVSSQALKTNTLTAQFGVYDPATNTFTIDNNANVVSALRTYADSDSAAASKVDGINSVLNMVDASGNVIKNEATFLQEIRTDVDTNSATAQAVTDLTATVGDENSGLVASVQTASDAVADIENGVKASYGLTVGAGNAISSMKLLAEDPLQPGLLPTSSIIFNTGSFKIQNGSGVDQFTINTNTGKAVFAGSLESVDGTFTGTLQAGDVTISNNLIEVENNSGSLRFTENGVVKGSVGAVDGQAVLVGTDFAALVSGSEVFVIGNGNGVSCQASDFNISSGNNNFYLNTSSNTVLFTSQGTSRTTYVSIDDEGMNITGDLSVSGNVSFAGGGAANYYLSNITRSGNTLTFVVSGAADQTYTFGANAFNSTTIPTNNNQLTNGAGYITSSSLSGLATESWVSSNFVPTSGSTSISGSLTATDFILSSDKILKENIKEYKAKKELEDGVTK